MSNLYGKFNHLNKTLQGKDLNLVNIKSKTTSFRNQLELYRKNFKNNQLALKRDFHMFKKISRKNKD